MLVRAKIRGTRRVMTSKGMRSRVVEPGEVFEYDGELSRWMETVEASAPAPAPVLPPTKSEAVPLADEAPVAPAAPSKPEPCLSEIKGIASALRARLERVGVVTLSQFLAKAGDPEGRRELIDVRGISPAQVEDYEAQARTLLAAWSA